MGMEIPNISKPLIISPEQMKDFVARVNAYKNGARNVHFLEQDIRAKMANKMRASPGMSTEDAVQAVILDRNLAVEALNQAA